LKLSRRNVAIEEQVNFAKGTVLHLRKAELTLKVTEKFGAGVEESDFSSSILGYGTEISNDAADNV
jgi:hypothetical protein